MNRQESTGVNTGTAIQCSKFVQQLERGVLQGVPIPQHYMRSTWT